MALTPQEGTSVADLLVLDENAVCALTRGMGNHLLEQSAIDLQVPGLLALAMSLGRKRRWSAKPEAVRWSEAEDLDPRGHPSDPPRRPLPQRDSASAQPLVTSSREQRKSLRKGTYVSP